MFSLPELPLWTIAIAAVIFFVVGLIGAVATVVLLPADYFVNGSRKYFWDHHLALRLIVLVVRNVLGAAVIVAGVVMLFTPGQGLLTILIGLMLITFPGKDRLIHSIVSRPAMLQAMNALRARFGSPPLQVRKDDAVEQPR